MRVSTWHWPPAESMVGVSAEQGCLMAVGLFTWKPMSWWLDSEKQHPGEGCQTGRVWRGGMEAEVRVQEGRTGRRWLLCGQVLQEHIGLKIQSCWRVWYITLNSAPFSEGSLIIPFMVSKHFDWIGMINPRRRCELPILVLRQMYFHCYFCVSFYFISPLVYADFIKWNWIFKWSTYKGHFQYYINDTICNNPHSTQWFPRKWYFMHLNIFGYQRELPLNFPCN